jgi:hypothetical protein
MHIHIYIRIHFYICIYICMYISVLCLYILGWDCHSLGPGHMEKAYDVILMDFVVIVFLKYVFAHMFLHMYIYLMYIHIYTYSYLYIYISWTL